MASLPRQFPDHRSFQVQNQDPPDPTKSELMKPTFQPFHLPSISSSSVPGSAPPAYADEPQLYDLSPEDGFEYSQQSADLYDELVHKYPAIVADLADMLPSTIGVNPDVLSIVDTKPAATATDNPTSSSAAVFTASRTDRYITHKYDCAVCGHSFDRASRARDCAFRDLGETPHACKGRCKKRNCTKAYSSEALLKEHVTGRFTPCPHCGTIISKKNLARHRQEVCY